MTAPAGDGVADADWLEWCKGIVAAALDAPGGPDPLLLSMLDTFSPFPTVEQEVEHRVLVVAFWIVRRWSERVEEVDGEAALELR